MADKYCDHGLYGSAVVVGNITGTTTLTVTSLTSGALGLGAAVTGTGIPANTYISALGTGTGGTGTYTLSQACTNGSGITVTATYGGPALVPPTWAVAQEGDGTATGAATPAVVSISMTSMTAAAGNTISIGGAVLTCVASGATTNQFNAGSGATLVSNLVTAINRTTNTVTVQAAATGWATPKLQDAVYARIGSPTTTIDIMYRAGSATHNANSLAQVALSGFTGGGGPYTFSGGAGGAWGQLLNRSAAWPSGVAALGYGVFNNVMNAGVLSGGDTCYLRTMRNGVNIRAEVTGSSGTVNIPSGPAGSPVRFVADDGTKWPGDSGVFTLFSALTTNLVFRPSSGANDCSRVIHLIGKKLSSTDRNFIFRQDNGYGYMQLSLNGESIFSNIELQKGRTSFDQAANLRLGGSFASSGETVPMGIKFLGCVFKNEAPNYGGHIKNYSYSGGVALFQDCDFIDQNDSTAVTGGIMVTDTTYGTGAWSMKFIGCRASGFVSGSGFGNFYNVGNQARGVVIENCAFGNITLFDFKLLSAIPVNTALSNVSDARLYEDINNRAMVVSTLPGRRYYYETMLYIAEWNPASTWPLLRAQLPETYSGSEDRWVYRVVTANAPSFISKTSPISVLRLTKFNTLATATRTLTLELLADQTIDTGGAPLQKSEVLLLVRYTDDTGVARVETSFDLISGTDGNLATSTAGWTATQYDVNSVAHYYNKKSVSLATAYPIKTNTEVFIDVRIGKISPTTADWYFIDPEVDIS